MEINKTFTPISLCYDKKQMAGEERTILDAVELRGYGNKEEDIFKLAEALKRQIRI